MSPSRGVRRSALLLGILAVVATAVPALASFTEIVDGPAEPLSRSPRLIGMGRLEYVLEDANHRIGLWELGRNVAGIGEADSGSTVDFGPFTAAAGQKHDVASRPGYVRQELASRELRTFFEAWRRGENTTYGVYGDYISLRHDVPQDATIERRSIGSQPSVSVAIAGRMPYFQPDRMRYALRVSAADHRSEDDYRLFVINPAGEFLDIDGTQVGPPNLFTPDESDRSSIGVGIATSYRFGAALTAAAGFDYEEHDIIGRNDGFRNASEIQEDRPYRAGQASLTGALGTSVRWGVDARGWKSSSEQRWAFTSSAGVAVEPLTGRGKLLERDEEGSRLRGRLLWTAGPVQLGAGVSTGHRQVEITPPDPFDSGSLNNFIRTIFNRAGADTLGLPDSVIASRVEDRSWEAGGGAAWNGERWTLAVEASVFRSNRDLALVAPSGGTPLSAVGEGPRVVGAEGRTGAEWRVLDALALRGGYTWNRTDLDDFTEGNEVVAHGPSAGLGFRPPTADWGLDLGYSFEWIGRDFDDPEALNGNRQRLAGRLRWAF